jgi:topoisomerase-4 subunit B
LGEISPSEFKHFIGETMRLEPVVLDKGTDIERLLSFFMGENTDTRKNFMMENLRDDLDDIDLEPEAVGITSVPASLNVS